MTNIDHTTCPKCGAAIPGDAPGGLCPQCVLQGAEAIQSSTRTSVGRTAPPTIEEIAPHFPELEVLELIGAGGMGAVYKARQPQLDRTVALKILSHDLASDPAFVERFNREARVLARLSHPNIVGVYDFGTAGPYCYLLMEYVDGVNLRQAMQAGGFTPTESLALVEDICAALKFAHEEGILHRDIKPENVLLDAKGRVKIADFGIAKLIGEGERADVTLTLQGSVLGSPHYMAPEQIETPADVDQRADIYSLGVVLYEMLTGELPIGRFALPSSKAAMDARIDEIVLRTLEKERQARFQTAEEVRTSVGELAKSPPVPAAAPASQSDGERPMAKFSLASALLTGVSLILGAILILMVFTLQPTNVAVPASDVAEVAESTSASLPLKVLAIGVVLLMPVTALVGLILGAMALGDIRASGGRKRGLGLATFGALAWPVIVLFFLTSLPLAFVPAGGGVSISWLIMFPLLLISGILAAYILVRGVVRWAGGVEDKDGARRHPGFGGALLRSVLIAILLPTLGILLATAFAGGNSEGGEGPRAPRPEAAVSSSSSADRFGAPAFDVRWRTGSPELTLPLVLKPDQVAEMKIFLRKSDGTTTEVFSLGQAVGRAQFPREHVLQVGTELVGTVHRLVVTKSGMNSGNYRGLTDLRGYEFNRALPAELRFDVPGRHEYTLATRREEGADTPDQTLVLEVVVKE